MVNFLYFFNSILFKFSAVKKKGFFVICEVFYKGACNATVSAANFMADQAGHLAQQARQLTGTIYRSLNRDGSMFPYITRPIVAALHLLREKGQLAIGIGTAAGTSGQSHEEISTYS